MLSVAPMIIDDSRLKSAIVFQMQLPFNRVYLDESLHLAPNPKSVKDHWKCNSKAENLLLEHIVKQFKKSGYFGGQRFHTRTYKPIFSCILANLQNAHIWNKQLIYSRRTNGKNKLWIRCFDFLIDLQLINSVITPANDRGFESWATALPELINLLNRYKTRIVFKEHHPALVVRDNDKNILPIPTNNNKRFKFDKMAKVPFEHNQLWLNHSVTLDNKVLVPFTQRKCNNTLELGGRFYGEFQTIPSKDRARLKIDCIDTVELDYKSQHMAIVYAWEGLELKGDPYLVEGFDRETIKAVTLRALNINNLSNLKSAITLSANPDNKAKYKAYKQARGIHDRRVLNGLCSNAPSKPKWIDSFIENVPTGTDANKLIEAFSDKHRDVFKHIGSKDIGLRLQAVDSQIMALMIASFNEELIPCLPIHDSVIIKQTDKAKARLIMQTAFKEVTGKHCLIEQK